jgi:hypothetical protein
MVSRTDSECLYTDAHFALNRFLAYTESLSDVPPASFPGSPDLLPDACNDFDTSLEVSGTNENTASSFDLSQGANSVDLHNLGVYLSPQHDTGTRHLAPATPAVRGLSNTTPTYPQRHLEGSQDAAAACALGANLPSHFDRPPSWPLQQSKHYYSQRLQFKKLISPNRGRGLQVPLLPPVISSNAQVGPRCRSPCKALLKDSSIGKGTATGGNRSRLQHSSDKNRSITAQKEISLAKMPPKQAQSSSLSGDLSRKHPNCSTLPSASHLS